MAEGYEPYHVPQQSRRDKLRVVAQAQTQNQTQTQSHHPTSCLDNFQECDHGLLVPFCAPSLISTSNLLTCTTTNCSSNINTPSSGAGKEVNLMGYLLGGMINNTSSSSSNSHHLYMDLQSSVQFNPAPVPSINTSNPSLFTPQNLRASLDHSLVGAEVVGYKPDSLPTVHDVVNSGTGQGLSLSLSSHHTQQNHSSRPLELQLQRYESSMFSGKVSVAYTLPAVDGSGLTSNDLARSSILLGPWTGYTFILKGSRFLKPAQQLLEELCEVGRGVYADRNTADSDMMNPPLQESLGASGIIDDPQSCSSEGKDQRRKKSRLISLLNEVYRTYKQYYEEMQAVTASFESVAGLGNAAPFVSLALKAMSKHFRCLKNAITDQLHFTLKAHGHAKYGKDQNQVFVNPDEGFYSQIPVHNSAFIEHQPVWRPQRGLPERAVTVLRTWLFDHFLRPYPTDTDKLMLAKQTGLSRNQVSNWFINARVRLWKPMVEEIHKLETRQAQKAFQREGQHANRPNDNSLASEHPSTSTQGIQEFPSKRTRSDFPTIPIGSDDQLNLSYENLSRQSHFDVNLNAAGGIGHVSLNTAGGSSGVSLTLGLHQNNGIGLSEAFPMSVAGRFSIDGNGEGYIVGGFEAQNGQFGREVIGGQLLHDFVG